MVIESSFFDVVLSAPVGLGLAQQQLNKQLVEFTNVCYI